MNTVYRIFGQGDQLSELQMCARAVLVFLIAIFYLRLAGKRSFGMNTPLDFVITMLLGSILSRAVTGASPFLPTVLAAGTLVILHRLSGWLAVLSHWFGIVFKGKETLIYHKGRFIKDNMTACMVTENDMRSCLRQILQDESFEQVESMYIERNGTISITKKQKA